METEGVARIRDPGLHAIGHDVALQFVVVILERFFGREHPSREGNPDEFLMRGGIGVDRADDPFGRFGINRGRFFLLFGIHNHHDRGGLGRFRRGGIRFFFLFLEKAREFFFDHVADIVGRERFLLGGLRLGFRLLLREFLRDDLPDFFGGESRRLFFRLLLGGLTFFWLHFDRCFCGLGFLRLFRLLGLFGFLRFLGFLLLLEFLLLFGFLLRMESREFFFDRIANV